MIARIIQIMNITFNARIDEPLCQIRCQQQMVQPQTCIARPSIAPIAPERIGASGGILIPERIGPALIQNGLERRPAYRMDQRVSIP